MNRLQAKLEKIGRNPKVTAQAVGLRYAACSDKGYFRKGQKEAFYYVDHSGKRIKDKEILDRIKSLVIPPAWENVWISPYENGHLQVTGTDLRGRRQYRYHPNWNKIRNQSKFFRLRNFAKALPAIRKRLESDLRKKGLPYEKVVALVIKLIELTDIRIGNEAYKKLYGSFGLTTLRDKHVKQSKSGMYFEFTGKKGIQHKIGLSSKRLIKLVLQCKEIPGQELFQYYDDQGNRHSIGSGDVNSYLKEISGEDFTAKDFRAWSASVNALENFLTIGTGETLTKIRSNVIEVLDCVAKKLGNTRTVCKKYYVHPTVIAAYESGSIYNYKPSKAGSSKLEPRESALVRLLKNEKIAEVIG